MPVIQGKTAWPHRDKLQELGLHGLAMVARSGKPEEVKTDEKVLAALQKEWDSLRAMGME